ncbi:MAG TPA: prephenate dehydratase, partial [Alphaproteobacteria bacterium]|nr:prephenate dehydratase [Alphaproteobacteria bacterium]
NSDLACRALYPSYTTLPCIEFEEAFAAVRDGKADLAMIPIENSVAGRVADVHYLLPEGGLHIIGEHFQPIVHHLLAVKGAKLKDIKRVESHVQALAQCRKWLLKHKMKPVVHADTAGAAADIAKKKDKSVAAIATELAGKIYGLTSLASGMANYKDNTTRFVILAKQPKIPPRGTKSVTTLIFRVRSIPAALYKALGSFATNGVNITKIESYLVGGHFSKAQFRVDLEGHPQDRALKLALDELNYVAQDVRILGVYPAHKFRLKG